jgi:tRNA(fMet)-specific endonuclease VapC
MLHMLDTDMASYIIRGRSPSVREKLAAVLPSMICVSVMTLAELLYGLKKLPPGHRLHVAVRRFFTIIRVLPWEAGAADFYADIRHRLVTTGQPIGEMDMMIAAHSLAIGAALVTNNARRYERIPGLVLINWA